MKKRAFLKIIALSAMMLTAASVQAQSHWTYSYDETGNRTQRTVTSASARQRTSASARQRTSATTNYLIADDKAKAVLNANHSQLKIETLGNGNADVTIYDLTGKEMIFRHAESESTVVDLSNLHRGTYVLSIEVAGEKKSCKFNK